MYVPNDSFRFFWCFFFVADRSFATPSVVIRLTAIECILLPNLLSALSQMGTLSASSKAAGKSSADILRFAISTIPLPKAGVKCLFVFLK
jgi:hypothetical protein